MVGIKAREFAPVERLTFEQLVPRNRFYRYVERVLDLSFMRGPISPTTGCRGRSVPGITGLSVLCAYVGMSGEHPGERTQGQRRSRECKQ